MIYFVPLFFIVLLVLLFRYPAQTLILIILIALQNFFYLVNLNALFRLPVFPGISLNFTDFMALLTIPVIFFFRKNLVISRQFIAIFFFLWLSVFWVVVFSFLALDATLGLIGNRLRGYFIYLFIPALFYLTGGEKRFRYLFFAVYAVGLAGCLIQFAEFVRGQQFYIPGGMVVNPYFIDAGTYEGVPRFWNRANAANFFMLPTSLAFVISKTKKKLIYLVPLFLSVLSLLLSFTRTAFIYGLLCVGAVFALSAMKNKARVISYFAIGSFLVTALLGIMLFTGKGDVGKAISKRFFSIGDIMDEKVHTTMDVRKDQFNKILKIASKSNFPLIFGLGITNQSVQLYTSDHGYLNILVNLGILGLVFIFWLLYYLFSKSWRLYRTATDEFNASVALGVVCALPGMIVTGINFNYFMGNYFFLTVAMIVMLETIANIERIRSNREERPIPVR